MKISFVIQFHSTRKRNLEQALRFLEKREDLSNSEFILVCQDNCNELIRNIKPINLNLDSYSHSKLCNEGVKLAKNEIVALMDSDRILPENYFKSIYETIKPKQFVSTWNMYKLKRRYSDMQIKEGKIEKTEDFKSKDNKICEKNLFAGNVVFFKQDYWDAGGMDERYIGYGISDTDMTKTIETKGYEIIWKNDEETHLYHPNTVFWKGKNINKIAELFTACNLIRFYKKWNCEKETKAIELIRWVRENFKNYPEEIQSDLQFKIIQERKTLL